MILKIRLFLLLALWLNNDLHSQSYPLIAWERSYGGGPDDIAYSIDETAHDGLIVAGSTNSDEPHTSGYHGGGDYWVIKLDAAGNIKWEKALGGSHDDYATSVEQLKGGGYIVAGSSKSEDGDITLSKGEYDFWIVKLESDGTLKWQKNFGGTEDDEALAVQSTSDGGFIIAGSTLSNDKDVSGNHGSFDFWIVKTDSAGNLLWQKCFGGSKSDIPHSITQTADDGYVVAGSTKSNDGDVSEHDANMDYWIIRLNSSGDLIWEKTFGGSDEDIAYSIAELNNGDLAVAGYSRSNDGDITQQRGGSDYWILRLEANGNLIWQKSLGGDIDDIATSLRQSENGGLMVMGYSFSNTHDVSGNHGSYDYWLIKLNDDGIIEWQKCFGGSNDDVAYAVLLTTDGGCALAGYSASDDGDISDHQGSKKDIWIVRLQTVTETGEIPGQANSFHIYPNPVKDHFILDISLTGRIGQRVTIEIINPVGKSILDRSFSLTSGQNLKTISINESVPQGLYLLRVTSPDQQWTSTVAVQ